MYQQLDSLGCRRRLPARLVNAYIATWLLLLLLLSLLSHQFFSAFSLVCLAHSIGFFFCSYSFSPLLKTPPTVHIHFTPSLSVNLHM